LALALVTSGRAAARAYCRRHPDYIQNTVIVGAGDVGQLVGRKLVQHREYGIKLVGFVDGKPLELRDDLRGQRVLGAPEALARIAASSAGRWTRRRRRPATACTSSTARTRARAAATGCGRRASTSCRS